VAEPTEGEAEPEATEEMTMDDYYSLLGVEPDAPTNDIRSAYRDRKAALDEKGDKTEIAKVNRAWNVLSDPYQRGRYDEQRGHGAEPDAEEPEEATVASSASGASPPARRRLFEPRPRGERAPLVPTIDLPPGRSLAQQRPRLIAMVIDVAVMIVLLFGVQGLVGDRLVERWYPDEHAELESITNDPPGEEQSQIDEANDRADESDEAADEAEDDNAENAAELRETADADEEAYDDLNDRVSDLSRDVYPAGIVVLEAIMLACLAYLVIPSALSGQTLGKRLQKIRVIRQDGSPLGWGGALVRYGLIILVTNLLLLIPGLGAIGIAIVFIVVLGWMRNGNRQAMQDRIAKTLVVDA
jgi:curved DNA-binding protein CbpA